MISDTLLYFMKFCFECFKKNHRNHTLTKLVFFLAMSVHFLFMMMNDPLIYAASLLEIKENEKNS